MSAEIGVFDVVIGNVFSILPRVETENLPQVQASLAYETTNNSIRYSDGEKWRQIYPLEGDITINSNEKTVISSIQGNDVGPFSSISTGDVMTWNGSSWINSPPTSGSIRYIEVSVTNSQFKNVKDAPVLLLPPPGNNLMYIIRDWYIIFSAGALYTGGSNLAPSYSTTFDQSAACPLIANLINSSGNSRWICGGGPVLNSVREFTNNSSIYLTVSDANFSGGEGQNLKICLFYNIVSGP